MSDFPRFIRVRQNFSRRPPLDLPAAVGAEFGKLRPRLRAGMRVAVGVGSRGISRLPEIIRMVVANLRAAGAEPFLLPAMGSHGGATPEGQREVLASYGITEEAMGAPIRASVEVRPVGRTAEGTTVYCSVEALGADGILLVNRIKPHTDFCGRIGSGLLKMAVVGLGKQVGAAAMHLSASQVGHERAIRGMAGVLVQNTPILGGLAIIEDQFHETARLAALRREEMEAGEDDLLEESRALMPLLPFEELDLLIVDWLGKNISGAGIDPNVTNRWVNGYFSSLPREGRPAPFIRRLFVRDLTPESHGNAIGIGLADVTTTRLIRAMDARVTGINSLTSLTPHTAKIPIHFDTDREAIARLLASVPLARPADARVARIADTLSLVEFAISEPLWRDVQAQGRLTALGELQELAFNADGNLA